ncbi:uncharacterized protein [Miscanthus floridulus]|uniref:uncharacterized protein isoform X1 n=1 Tax=Miscanthus floridulus TaxID=154761 RepID=UPI00345A8E24
MQRDFVESLSNMQKLQHIDVYDSPWLADTAMWEAAGFVLPRPLHYLGWHAIRFSKLPSCINPSALPILAHLQLFVITMDEQDLKLLARLPALYYLDLTTESTVTASNINAGDRSFFQKLTHFVTNAMVQFEQANEGDTSISLHMWNGEDDMPFASRKGNKSRKVVPSGVMPNLQVLYFNVHLRALKDNYSDYYGNIGLEYLPSLRELKGRIDHEDVSVAESDAVLAALRDAMQRPSQPSHVTVLSPFIAIIIRGENNNVSNGAGFNACKTTTEPIATRHNFT